MRIIIGDFMSLDGVVQAPGGADEDTDGGFRHGGWTMPFFDPETMGATIGAVMDRTDERDQEVRRSHTLTSDEAASRWNNTTLLERDAIDAIRALRGDSRDRGLQVLGSASLARQLVEHELVDEYWILLEPILLGGGKAIFPADGTARPLGLVPVQQASTGVLICNYRPAVG